MVLDMADPAFPGRGGQGGRFAGNVSPGWIEVNARRASRRGDALGTVSSGMRGHLRLGV